MAVIFSMMFLTHEHMDLINARGDVAESKLGI